MNPVNPDIDPGHLKGIGALDDPAVRRIIERFFESLAERLAEIAAAPGSAAARLLHRLRGSAANCGFPALAEACRAAEVEPDAPGRDARLADTARRAAEAWAALGAGTAP
jgi:HPt (histidine-containing phosphotransfer) domain-containing protein